MSILNRQTFSTSRDLDFLTERELTAQIGYNRHFWAEVAVKELVDNALDAAEDAGSDPVIDVTRDYANGMISVTDQGPGIPPEIVTRIADYSTRTSSREAYVGITRGAQGNAWMTLLAMPRALGGGHVVIESMGQCHRLDLRPHPLTGKIEIGHEITPSDVKTGTRVSVNSARWIDDLPGGEIYNVLDHMALVNPTAEINLDGHTILDRVSLKAPKWSSAKPASAHWYSCDRFHRLLTARLAADPGLALRDFLKDFDGLSGSAKQKQVTDVLGLTRAPLAALQLDDGSIDPAMEKRLHAALCGATKPPRAARLGTLGEAALARAGDQLKYAVARVDDDLTPAVIEAVLVQDRVVSGSLMMVNHTSPPAPHFAGLDNLLESTRLLTEEAEDCGVTVVVHIACPGIDFSDRGKRNVILPERVRDALRNILHKVTKPWQDQFNKIMKDRRKTSQRMPIRKDRGITTREAAFAEMERAYLKASSDGTLPAAPRQIMYAARGPIMESTRKALDDQYFCQTLLWNYIKENPDLTAGWKIAVDPRGNLVEPHTDKRVPLGTIQVEKYMARADDRLRTAPPSGFAINDIETSGPRYRYGAVLFVEKEGFQPILEAAQLPERFDISVMSTKGMSVTAARQLVDWFTAQDVPVLAIRDFDVSGFVIAGTLREDTRRHQWKGDGAIDLGLRLADVEAMGLDSEPVKNKGDIIPSLQKYGATEAEIEFLQDRRVELNQMDSRQMIAWIEGKLRDHGVKKMVPDAAEIAEAARDYAHAIEANRILAKMEIEPGPLPEPETLRQAVMDQLIGDPAQTWDTALAGIVKGAV